MKTEMLFQKHIAIAIMTDREICPRKEVLIVLPDKINSHTFLIDNHVRLNSSQNASYTEDVCDMHSPMCDIIRLPYAFKMRQDYLSTSYLDQKYLPSERSETREI